MTASSHDRTGSASFHGGSPEAQIAPVPRISLQAFCESADVAQVIQSAASDRRMNKAHIRVQMGGLAAAVEAYRSAATPNVIMLESSVSSVELLDGLDRLAETCDADTKLIVIGHVNDVLLYRELVRRGVSEYVIAPISVVSIVRAVSDLYRSPGAEPLGRTVAFVGAKGGVGASTVCHNVAFAITRSLSLSTVVVDLDLPYGTAGLDFNQDPPQGIADAVFAPERVDANLVDRLLSKCTDHLSLLAAPATLDRAYDFPETGFDSVLDILRNNVPCVVLDVPHLWTGWARRVLVAADEIIIVAEPDLGNLRNTKTLFDLLRAQRPNDKMPHLVLNKAGLPKRPEIKPADFGNAVEAEPSAIIPFDANLFGMAGNNGQMIAEVNAQAKPAEIFTDLAQIVTGRSEVKRSRKSLLDPLLSALARKRA